MDTNNVLAQANIVVTKEDIVQHELDKFVCETKEEMATLNKNIQNYMIRLSKLELNIIQQ